jgi:hypothetical protein
MKHIWFYYCLIFFFTVTVFLEIYGVLLHDYTLSDFIITNIKIKYRIAILAFLCYHFLVEYK